MRKQRKNYTSQEKVFILKRHLVDRVPVSDICDEYHLQPTVFYRWQSRYGKVNEHKALIPRDFWLEEWEKQAIINFHVQYPLEGYRRPI